MTSRVDACDKSSGSGHTMAEREDSVFTVHWNFKYITLHVLLACNKKLKTEIITVASKVFF